MLKICLKYILIFSLSTLIQHAAFSGIPSWNELKDTTNLNGITYNIHSHWVDSVFSSLTPEDRICQLFMAAAYSNQDQKHVDEDSDLIKNYHIGSLIFFHGTPVKQAIETNLYQSLSKTPLLIGIDGEWGLGMRLDSTMSFPRQMMLGAMNNDSLVYAMGHEIANQLKSIGVQINFAPVIDINNNPLNPVINNRSFGENKFEVAQKGLAYMKGLQENGIIATAKHFPGHGDTNADSHKTLPVINFNFERLDTLELYPFRDLIHHQVGGVMVAHLFIPCLDTTKNTASTLSRKVVTGLLVDSLHFHGLIFTDALNMKGVSEYFPSGELEVKALQAGNDVLVMPADIPKALNAIENAIACGTLRQSQIDSSCRKILAAKEWAGLNKYKPIDIEALKTKLHNPAAQLTKRKIIESSLTLIQNQNHLIPLKRLDTLRLAVVLVGINQPNQFEKSLSLYSNFDCYFLDKQADSTQIDSLMYNLRHYNLVIAGVHNTDSRPTKNFGITPNEIAFLDTLSASKSVILDFFATPYALSYLNHLNRYKSILVSYQDMPMIQDYSAQLIFGAIGAQGKLSVTASVFGRDTGLKTEGGIRLKYTIPEEVHIDSKKLLAIDTIVNQAIRDKAMPGCVILAAKNGTVFYRKAFGYQTYDSIHPVQTSDIYDLASITKIAATLPSVMRLYEQKRIKLYHKISSYLPGLRRTNKRNITLIDMLTHQARLQPYIPFYWRLLEPIHSNERLTSKTYSPKYSIQVAHHLYANNDLKYKKGLITSHPDLTHRIEVADSVYLLNTYTDSIFNISNKSPLLPVKEYKYSDMGFYYLYWMIEHLTGKALNEYVQNQFYNKLGANTMGYLPLNRFSLSRIAPTEDDKIFRKQVVHGFVDDPGAAMMGGVCGHAGLFSDADDLAKLMQMYLNKGTYGGEQYFKPTTITYFSSCPFCKTNRRGIGFDRPVMNSDYGPTCRCVSSKSFGHTGFTGTMTWVDPENGLLYVFLSNRVYPDPENFKIVKMNVRTRIQQVLVNSLNTYTKP